MLTGVGEAVHGPLWKEQGGFVFTLRGSPDPLHTLGPLSGLVNVAVMEPSPFLLQGTLLP